MKTLNEKTSIDSFIKFASEYLNLQDKPNVKLVQEKEPHMTSACYSSVDKSITVLSKDRKFMDIARSIAHEMVHQKQHERDGADKLDGTTGSYHEDEANAVAGRIVRKYGEENPEIYTEQSSIQPMPDY